MGGWVGGHNGNKMLWFLTNLGHYTLLRSTPWASNLRPVNHGSLCVQWGSHLPLTERLGGFKWNQHVRSLERCYYSCLETNKASLLPVWKGGSSGQWSCTGTWFISGRNSKENAKFFKWWGHRVQTGIGGGAMKKTGVGFFPPLNYF